MSGVEGLELVCVWFRVGCVWLRVSGWFVFGGGLGVGLCLVFHPSDAALGQGFGVGVRAVGFCVRSVGSWLWGVGERLIRLGALGCPD